MELCCSSTTFSLNLSLQTNKKFRTLSPQTSLSFTNKLYPSPACTPLSLPTHKTPTKVFASAAYDISASFSSSPHNAKTDELPAPLDVQLFEEPNSKVRLSVTVPKAVCDDCYRKVMRETGKNLKIPGFRPGKKIPEGIILRLVGKNKLQKETVKFILERTVLHAMLLLEGRALQDSFKIMNEDSYLLETYISQKPLRYDVLVDVLPEVTWSPENGYKNLKIVVEIDKIAAEAACEQELTCRYKLLGDLSDVADRGLQVGDVALVDISAVTIEHGGAGGQNIPSAEDKGFQFDTEEKDTVLPGFLDAIIGIRPGETKSFPLVFPESWKQEYLRGVQALFTVECQRLYYRDLPPLDDSLADELLPGCLTLAEVKEALLQTAKDQATEDAIWDQIRKMVRVDIPKTLLEKVGEGMYGIKILDKQGSMRYKQEQLEDMLSQKAINEYIEHDKEDLVKIIKHDLAIRDILKRENLQVTGEELAQKVAKTIVEYEEEDEFYDEESLEGEVEDKMMAAKVLEWLREHAEIQYVTP